MQRSNHPMSDNNLELPKQHHNKDSSVGYSISSDFVRDTKWDVVYLTSSPLVFGSGTYKPLDQVMCTLFFSFFFCFCLFVLI